MINASKNYHVQRSQEEGILIPSMQPLNGTLIYSVFWNQKLGWVDCERAQGTFWVNKNVSYYDWLWYLPGCIHL